MMVFAIGYGRLNVNRFMSLLTKHNIETVVDVLALPLPSKPGFSNRILASILIKRDWGLPGRDYAHIH